MATLQSIIPDDLQRPALAGSRARGVTVCLLIDEALQFIAAPDAFASEEEVRRDP
jgi:hypothetical protein